MRSATCLRRAIGTYLSQLIKFFMAKTIFQRIISKGRIALNQPAQVCALFD
jgi:hypothetical protein